MKSSIQFVTLLLLSVLLSVQSHAQSIKLPGSGGRLEILMKNTSLPDTSRQPFTLLGCNTRIDSSIAGYWGKKITQTVADIPYGEQFDLISEDSYFISKYYLASPPIMAVSQKCDTIYDLGILTPDEFSLTTKNDNQKIIFDYDTLQMVNIHYLDINYKQLKGQFEYVPIKVTCDNFLSKSGTKIGGSGIGTLNVDSSRLFLPYHCDTTSGNSSEPLNCVVTILNDIIPGYKILFDIDAEYCVSSDSNSMCESINLKKFFMDGHKKVKLKCIKREPGDIPSGCKSQ